MQRILVIAACGLALSACAGVPGMSSFRLPGSGPSPTTVQFESEPAGAEARTSIGEACQTPCSMVVTADDFTVTFSQAGFAPQTVPVRMTPPVGGVDPVTGEVPPARLAPNPVYVELQPAGAPPPRRGTLRPRTSAAPTAAPRPATTAVRAPSSSAPRPVSATAPRPAAVRAPAAPRSSMPPPPPAPEPAPAAAWPPVTR